MAFAGAAQLHLLEDSSVVHHLEDSSVVHVLEDSSEVLVGSRAYYMLIVVAVVLLLLVLMVGMSPAALPGRFVGGSIARSYHASRFLSLHSRGVVVPQAFALFATIASPPQMYAILLLRQKCIRPVMSSS